MSLYAAGHDAAFAELYRRVAPRLFAYLLTLTHSTDSAEDLLQVTFAKLHRARASYLTGAAPMSWLVSMARNAFLDDLRTSWARRELVTEEGSVPEPAPVDGNARILASIAVRQAMATLPAQYREPILLTKLAGLSVLEAARELGTTRAAVKLRVHRGYKLLRQRYLDSVQL